MAFTIAEELQRLGVAGPLAKEYEKQLTTGPVSVPRLQASGVATQLAVILTKGITAKGVNRSHLSSAGMPYPVAAFMAKEINTITNSVLPSIASSATVGQTLVTTNGTWVSAKAPTYTYQWMTDGVDIAGANAQTYIVVAADVGKVITVRVTASNGDNQASAISNATSAVVAA